MKNAVNGFTRSVVMSQKCEDLQWTSMECREKYLIHTLLPYSFSICSCVQFSL